MSWRVGGFEGELLKDGARTQSICFESPDGAVQRIGGTRGKISTRRRYPQQSGQLRAGRWCSGCLKIDVGRTALCNQRRFNNSRTLFISGERAEESPARANYAVFEPHESDLHCSKKARHIARWRPVHGWSEAAVWEIIQRWSVDPHPAYKLGFSRCSCRACIFNQDAAWATLALLDPAGTERHCQLEDEFGWTIDRNGRPLRERIASAQPFQAATEPAAQVVIQRALSFEKWNQPIRPIDWSLPPRAYSSTGGPS
ncbi:phosphoadenosine phosphosulfate reductase family protein [Sphaerothrix gracilis]|uniref:phosphoadenosine phosphosulfate reductase domain-containing protein n=1 Tax=Sphaerothrix gracilis TaxID=3151835 RepID=UPI0031FE24B8